MSSGDLQSTTTTTVGDDLQVLKQDQLIRSDPGDYKRRRTIAIQRAHGGSCGFTLQVRMALAVRPHRVHPTVRLSHFDLPRHTWSLMNCFWTGQGPCCANLHK